MSGENQTESMLSACRVLDLTDEKGLLCGKILGDLGADVIKIERPGGDPARRLGPFYQDRVDPEKSLYWWAFNTSKRGITLDITKTDGRALFKKLVEGADLVLESFPPGTLQALGLDYPVLEAINPRVILVSITPFGQTGPYREYKAPDIVAWATGGVMYQWGDADRPPLHISHHSQAYLHAGADGAVGALMALSWRHATGQGQHVDVSVQASVAQLIYFATVQWDMVRVIQKRGSIGYITVQVTRMWPCKDGHVIWIYFGGGMGYLSRPLVRWMEDEEMADDFLRSFDWEAYDLATTTQEVVDRIEVPTRRFFQTHTKAELYEGALKYNALVYPVATTADIVQSAQLAAREFWAGVEHPELGVTLSYPGAFIKVSETPVRLSRRAPLIGEHNHEILEGKSGFSKEPIASPHGIKGFLEPRCGERAESPANRALEGIKVADFTWWIAAPLATKYLADFGAQVIRIESNSRPDLQRTIPPFKDGEVDLNRCGQFNQYNTSKLSVAVNLADPRGRDLAKRLVAWADVVVENFAAGVMKKLGLDYEQLKEVNPDLIMLSSCMHGQTGPHAEHPGFGWHLTALAGLHHLTGWPDREPVGPAAPYIDFIAPRYTAAAILAALEYRRRTGKGQYLDLSQYETGIQFISPLLLDYNSNKRVAGRMGNRSDHAAPHGVYRCRGEDRWCAVAVFTEEEWQNFCRVIGKPQWTRSPRFADLRFRKQNEDELDRLVEAWTVRHRAEDVMGTMQEAGVAAGLVETGQDLLEYDPQLRHRHFFRKLDHPEVGTYAAPEPGFVLSRSPCEMRRAPLLGEHNELVFSQILGMSDEEIARLVTEGVIE